MSQPQEGAPPPQPWRALAIGFVLGAVLLAAGLGVWTLAARRNQSAREMATPPPAPEVERPAPELVPTPSIAEPAPPPPVQTTPPARAPSAPVRRRAPQPPQPPKEVESSVRVELGSLHVESDVPGASIFIDRKFVGAAPLTVPNLTPGQHQLNVSAEGYDGVAQAVDIVPGENRIAVKFTVVAFSRAIDVIHQHAFGSCKGRLSADPQGVKYETTNQQDGFAIAFSDLAPFEINYLKKTLTVGRRGGRTYSFTDNRPDPNVLFVFHRDVQKVRLKVTAQ